MTIQQAVQDFLNKPVTIALLTRVAPNTFLDRPVHGQTVTTGVDTSTIPTLPFAGASYPPPVATTELCCCCTVNTAWRDGLCYMCHAHEKAETAKLRDLLRRCQLFLTGEANTNLSFFKYEAEIRSLIVDIEKEIGDA